MAATEEQLSSVTFAYVLASLRGSSVCLCSGCCGGAVVFRNFCLYSGIAAWAAASVYILAATEEQLYSVTFACILASLRSSSLCLYSGCYGGAVLFRDFAYILASLRGSSLCLYPGCYEGAVLFRDFAYTLVSLRGSSLCLYSGCGGGLSSEILPIFWRR